jgi:DASH complex subunit SPC19
VLSLGEGTADYARLIDILQVTQAYELVSVDDIEQAKMDVEAHVEPQIQQLIQRAEKGLEALQRKERRCNEQVHHHHHHQTIL